MSNTGKLENAEKKETNCWLLLVQRILSLLHVFSCAQPCALNPNLAGIQGAEWCQNDFSADPEEKTPNPVS